MRNLNWTYIFPLFHLFISFANPVTIRNRLPVVLLLFFMKSGTTQAHQHASSSDSVLCNYMSLLGQTESCALYLKKDLSICRELIWGFEEKYPPVTMVEFVVHSRGLRCHCLLSRHAFFSSWWAVFSLYLVPSSQPPNTNHLENHISSTPLCQVHSFNWEPSWPIDFGYFYWEQ